MEELLVPASALLQPPTTLANAKPLQPTSFSACTLTAPFGLVAVKREHGSRGNCFVARDLLTGTMYVSQLMKPMIDCLSSRGMSISIGGFSKAVHEDRLYKSRFHISVHPNSYMPSIVSTSNATCVVLLGDPAAYTMSNESE